MQLKLEKSKTPPAGGILALESSGGSMQSQSEPDGTEPIEIDISEDAKGEGLIGIIHGAAAFIMVSISGCTPKRR